MILSSVRNNGITILHDQGLGAKREWRERDDFSTVGEVEISELLQDSHTHTQWSCGKCQDAMFGNESKPFSFMIKKNMSIIEHEVNGV